MATDEGMRLLRECHAMLRQLTQGGSGIASDRELDDPKYGDPIVKLKPRDWNGQDYTACNYSATSAQFLTAYADMLEAFAAKKKKNGDAEKAEWDLRDARKARGWSARLENGWKSTKAAPEPQGGFDDVGWK